MPQIGEVYGPHAPAPASPSEPLSIASEPLSIPPELLLEEDPPLDEPLAVASPPSSPDPLLPETVASPASLPESWTADPLLDELLLADDPSASDVDPSPESASIVPPDDAPPDDEPLLDGLPLDDVALPIIPLELDPPDEDPASCPSTLASGVVVVAEPPPHPEANVGPSAMQAPSSAKKRLFESFQRAAMPALLTVGD